MFYNFTIVLQNQKTAHQEHFIVDVDPYKTDGYLGAWNYVVAKAKSLLIEFGHEWKILEIRHNN